jgi:hypothetical protein
VALHPLLVVEHVGSVVVGAQEVDEVFVVPHAPRKSKRIPAF